MPERRSLFQASFEDYYQTPDLSKNLLLPPRPNFHHYRIQQWNGIYTRLSRTIRSATQLANWISNEIPMNAYFTPTEWLDPSNVRRSRGRAQDYLLSSPLYFDLETKEAHIKGSIHLTLELIDYMERAYGRTPSWIIFSGRRGFHVYYWDWDDIVKEYGNPRDRLHQFIKSRKAIMKELDRASIKVDTTVTPDPWRVMRIPGTLHGKTGLVAVPVSDPSKFTIDCAKITS